MTVIQSFGELAQMQTGWSPTIRYSSLRLYNQLSYDYAALYRLQPNVRTCVDFLARNIAQLGLHVYRRVGETDRRRERDYGLARLLDLPLPTEFKCTRYRLIESLMGDLGVYFNAYWLKVRQGGEVRGLLRVPPPLVTVEGSMVPIRYEINLGAQVRKVEPAEIVHFRGYNPENALVGLSPLETLRRVLAEEQAMGDYREGFWANAARMAGLIERPKEAPKWTQDARDRFKAEFEALYSGDDNSGKTAILEEGMTWKQASFSAEESEYLAGRKLTREECARAYHIPLPLVGILDHATFSNIKEQHKNLYQDSLGPWLAMIEQEIELQLLPDFADSAGVYVEFNIAEKLKGSFEEQMQSMQSSVGRPWMTADEARARMNLPSLGGDAAELVTPLNVLVGGQASPRDSAPKTRQLAVTKAVDDRSTVWIGMYLPLAVAEVLAIEEGEAPEGLHMSLVYLGPQAREKRTLAAEVIRQWAHGAPSLRATVSGVGRFSAPDGEPEPFYASVDAPGLPDWRQDLVDQLKNAGLVLEEAHGFTPHITLAYVAPDAPDPVEAVPDVEFVFDKLTIAFGDVRSDFLLSEDVKHRSKAPAKRPQVDPTLLALRAQHERRWIEVLARTFRRQEAAMLSRVPADSRRSIGEVWNDGKRWNDELHVDLLRLNVFTAGAWARWVAKEVEDEFDEDQMLEWLDENARIAAEEINGTTRVEMADALAEEDQRAGLRHVFEIAITARAAQIATSKVTTASNFGSTDAARTLGLRSKTWNVNSANPRPEHASMDGETVGIGELFSNGLRWPGDPAGGAENNANCQCSVTFNK
jgi:HK97 family phage portal protein